MSPACAAVAHSAGSAPGGVPVQAQPGVAAEELSAFPGEQAWRGGPAPFGELGSQGGAVDRLAAECNRARAAGTSTGR